MNFWSQQSEALITAAIIIAIGLFIRAFGSKFLGRQFFRAFNRVAQDRFRQIFIDLLKKPIELFLLLLTFMLAFDRIDLPEDWILVFGKKRYEIESILTHLGKVLLTISITWIFLRSADFVAYVMLNPEDHITEPGDKQLVRFFKDIIKVIIALVALFFLLGVIYNMDVTSLITGLGIGGLAIALAAQETIANLIGSFVIFLDKPFVVGDLIESEKIKGVVESVGFRSTRIRTLDNNLLTVPNKKLVDSALNNLSRAQFRRIRQEIPLDHQTPTEKIRWAIHEIEEAIQKHPMTSENLLVVFHDVDEISLNILIIYYVMSEDLTVASVVKHELNYRWKEILVQGGISLAEPVGPRNQNSNSLL